jgi:hypothetical protein
VDTIDRDQKDENEKDENEKDENENDDTVDHGNSKILDRDQKDKNEKDRPVDDGKGKIFDASQYFCLLPRVKSTSQSNVINRVNIQHTTSGKRMVERL